MCVFFFFFFLQLTRWRGPGQTWRVRGNIFVAQIRSETPPDMFFILPLLCSATDTPIFCTSGNNHIPSHTDTVRVCWKQSIFSKKKKSGSVQCNKRSRSDQAKRIYFFFFFLAFLRLDFFIIISHFYSVEVPQSSLAHKRDREEGKPRVGTFLCPTKINVNTVRHATLNPTTQFHAV